MPLTRATHADASRVIDDLEAKGHRVVSIAADETGVYILSEPSKRAAPGAKETR